MLDNIYYCCIPKAATTWFKALFMRNSFKTYGVWHFLVSLQENAIFTPFDQVQECKIPEGNIITHYTGTYQCFKTKLTKSESFKGFFVYRDPRELIVSTYWSWLVSHGAGHPQRAVLQGIEDSLERWKYVIDTLGKKHLKTFLTMTDWVKNCDDPRIKIFKFEDFFRDEESQLEHLIDLLCFLELETDKDKIKKINEPLKFRKLSNGRNRGEIDNSNHFRSGIADSYRTELPKEALEYFYLEYPSVVEELGYSL